MTAAPPAPPRGRRPEARLPRRRTSRLRQTICAPWRAHDQVCAARPAEASRHSGGRVDVLPRAAISTETMSPASLRRLHCGSQLARWRAFNSPSPRKMIRMRFPWQPHEYARTCTVRSISMISVASRTAIDRGELTRKVRSASAANLSADTFRHCPKCGADHFTQRALRGELPE